MSSVTVYLNTLVGGTWTNSANAVDGNDLTDYASTITDAQYVTGRDSDQFSSIPDGATIQGIMVEVYAYGDGGDYLTFDLYDGTSYSSTENNTPGTSVSWRSVGGATSLWGKSWTVAQIKSASFYTRFTYHNASKANTMYVYATRVTVYYAIIVSKSTKLIYGLRRLVAHSGSLWSKYNEATGTAAGDSSGNGYTGTLSGVAFNSGGKYGYCVYSNGDDADRVNYGNVLNVTGSISITLWVKPTSTTRQYHLLVAKQQDTSNNRTYSLYLTWNGVSVYNIPQFVRGIGGVLITAITGDSSVGLSADEWHFIGIKVNSTTGAAKMLIDNTWYDATTATAGSSTSLPTIPLYVGDAYNNSTGRTLQGYIDDVRIFEREITDSEMYAIKNNESGLAIKLMYDILGTAMASTLVGLKYNIRGAVSTTRKFLWNMLGNLYVDTVAAYHLRNLVSTSDTLLYNIKNYSTAVVGMLWDINNSVAAGVRCIWNVRGLLSPAITKLIYNIRNTTSSTVKLVYNSFSRVSAAFVKILYNISGRLLAQTALSWKIYSRISANVSGLWNDRNRVGLRGNMVSYSMDALYNGTHTLDSSGNNYTLISEYGYIYPATGISGACLQSDGDDTMDMAFFAHPLTDMTIDFWMYPVDMTSAAEPAYKNETGEWSLLLNPDGSMTYQHYLTTWTAFSAGTFTTGSWYHIVVTRNNTTKTLRSYLNGSFVDEETYTQIPVSRKGYGFLFAGYNGYFIGRLDEFNLYDYVISESEIALHSSGIYYQIPRKILWNDRESRVATTVLKWNIKGTIDKTVSVLWNISSTATASTSFRLLWNVRNRIESSPDLLWNIRTSLSTDMTTVWNIRSSLVAAAKLVWNLKAFVTSVVDMLWTITTGRLNVFLKNVYNIREPVNDYRKPVGKFLVPNIIGTASELPPDGNRTNLVWKILERTSSGLVTINWRIFYNPKPLASFRTSYVMRNWVMDCGSVPILIPCPLPGVPSSGVSIRFRYDIINMVGCRLYTPWRILNISSASSRLLQYNIRSGLSETTTAVYNLRNSRAATVRLRYNMRQVVYTTRRFVYNLRTRVYADVLVVYNLLSSIIRTTAVFVYNIRGRVSQSRKFLYTILGRLTNTVGILWGMRGRLAASLKPVYNIRGLVSDSLTVVYRFVFYPVTAAIVLGYHLRNRISSRATLLFMIRNRLTTASRLIWNLRNRISNTRTLSWSIRGLVSKVGKLVYNIRRAASTDAAFIYNVRSGVSGIVRILYNLRKSVTARASFGYQILGSVGAGVGLLYDVIIRFGVRVGIRWNVVPWHSFVHGNDPYERLRSEIYTHLLAETASGGELEGFHIYKYPPSITPVYMPCVIIYVEKVERGEMQDETQDEDAEVRLEIVFKRNRRVVLEV